MQQIAEFLQTELLTIEHVKKWEVNSIEFENKIINTLLKEESC